MSEPSEEAQQTILVVDDEAEVRALVREILTLHGYNVIDTGDPIEAPPHRRGTADSPAAHRRGHADDERPRAGQARRGHQPDHEDRAHVGLLHRRGQGLGSALISKPFKTSDLVSTIKQMLDSKSAFRRPGPPPAPKPGFGPI